MEAKGNVLIVTDGSGETAEMAAGIAAALKDSTVTVKTASEFKGNDILPAKAFFLGCKEPRPDSFAYLTLLLKHINLASRPCGVFSPGSREATEYLAGLVCDCEAALNPEPLFSGHAQAVKEWAQSVVSGSFKQARTEALEADHGERI
ncbi:MAG: hypothetical protein FWC64_06005 [Treponema sp.]|nr:hypothetical protein [Treponema sp.]